MAETLAPAAAGAARGQAVKLDDLMLAMDVVDTLRHQDAFVARELNEDAREQELVLRLRKIYREQGIEVSDATIGEGVKALKESRFVYTPPKRGPGLVLARLWIARGRIGAALTAIAGAIGVIWAAYYFLAERPARIEAERAQIEISTSLPKALDEAYGEVINDAKTPAARPRADRLLADGREALARKDGAGAKAAISGLGRLSADLRQNYQLMIVSRPGEPSGVFRIPDRNTGARNYYLIVEAIGADGRPMALPITSEEDGSAKMTTKWGLRVDQQVYQSVAADKADDGIIQKRKVGEKRRGFLDVDYAIPTSGAAISQW
ncbi:conserved hypothetical protein [Methylocella tundrae]|uniref:Uncharacterized protein n=1 Tax=Methylocella tundrae TaxID=227605 RepID=A0A8B6M8J0_METTU|nr:DUF6384 family protein [Methylocella tundrae]VTZ50362.1 conserved hypothetical protein [Methylocella tundrae]